MKKIKAAENASRYLNIFQKGEGAESGVSVSGGVEGGLDGYFYSLCAPLREPHSQSTSPLGK